MNRELTNSCFLLAAYFSHICIRDLMVVRKAANSNSSVYTYLSYWFITARDYIFLYVEFHLLLFALFHRCFEVFHRLFEIFLMSFASSICYLLLITPNLLPLAAIGHPTQLFLHEVLIIPSSLVTCIGLKIIIWYLLPRTSYYGLQGVSSKNIQGADKHIPVLKITSRSL